MIFKTKNNELAILGNTLDDVKKKFDDFKKALEQHNLFGENGFFSSLFSGKKSNKIITPELLSQFDDFKKRFNNSKLSAEALAEEMGNVDSSIVNYAKTCKNGELTTEGFTTAIKQQTLSAKAATVVTKALAIAGNMLLMFVISEAISITAKEIDKLVHSLENSRKAAEDALSAINESNSSIKSNGEWIAKLLFVYIYYFRKK